MSDSYLGTLIYHDSLDPERFQMLRKLVFKILLV